MTPLQHPTALTTVLCAFLLVTAAHAMAEEPPPRLTNDTFSQDFADQAGSYLTRHPQAPEAPSVWLDMYVAATAIDDQETQESARMMLLGVHPSSIQARYVAKGLEDAEAYREFIHRSMDDQKHLLRGEGVGLFVQAIQLGLRVHGEQVLHDATFALRVAMLAEVLGSTTTRDNMIERVRIHADSEEPLEVAGLLFGDLSDPEKLAALFEMSDFDDARFFLRILLERLSEADRDHLLVTEVRIGRAMLDREFEQALTWLGEIDFDALEAVEGHEGINLARLRFWHGWALLASGEHEAGLAVWNQLRQQSPDNPWAELATRLSDEVITSTAFIDVASVALQRAVERLEAGVRVFTARAERQPTDDGTHYEAYLRIDTEANAGMFTLARDAQMILGYAMGEGGTRIYLTDEPHIHVLQGVRQFPMPDMTLDRGSDGQINFNLQARIGSDVQAMAEAHHALLDSPLLRTREGRSHLIERMFLGRNLPIGAEQQDADATLSWAALSVREPKAIIRRLHIDDDGVVRRFEGDGVVAELRYGDAAAIRLHPPSWPDLPEHHHDDARGLITIWGRLLGMFAEFNL